MVQNVRTFRKIIVVVGPTATGKSALAIGLAKKFDGEIISADSRQVYRGLNLGAGKVTKKEMAGVRHHMLDVLNPKRRFTAEEFQRMARKDLEGIFSRGRLPIICGGTGFYISALVDGTLFPNVSPNIKLRAILAEKPADELFRMLKKLDPRRARNIDKQNKRRLIRAIEIAKALGKVPAAKQDPSTKFDTLWLGLRLSPERLRKKIHVRLLKRMRQGMVSEAKHLHDAGLSFKRMEDLGLEYRYLSRYLKGLISKQEMLARLETEIWHYAKRQMTWFRPEKRISWFDAENPSLKRLTDKKVQSWLEIEKAAP